jgi:hypothetical protein
MAALHLGSAGLAPRRRAARAVLLAAAAAATLLVASGRALAQDPGEVASTATVANPLTLGLGGRRPYWSGTHGAPFLAASFEAGLVYVRPTMMLGYGKPHWRWFGAEVQSQIAPGNYAEYVGLRGALPFADLRAGARYSFTPSQSYLTRSKIYNDDELQFDENPAARYLSLEAELSIAAPVWNDGAFVFTLTGLHAVGVPDQFDIYDSYLNVVLEPPWAARQRVGYFHAFGVDDGLQVGFSAELIEMPERDAVVVRIGPQLGVAITHHLDAALSVMVPVSTPDDLRLEGAEIGQFGFRYRWASTDPFPEFP